MEIVGDALEALGFIFGSFIVAIGLSAGGWAIFAHLRHPEWGEPTLVLALALALATNLFSGQFLTMVTILMAMAIPFLWIEGRAWRLGGTNRL